MVRQSFLSSYCKTLTCQQEHELFCFLFHVHVRYNPYHFVSMADIVVRVCQLFIFQSFSSEITGANEIKLGRNDTSVVFNIFHAFHFIQKFNMASKAQVSLQFIIFILELNFNSILRKIINLYMNTINTTVLAIL